MSRPIGTVATFGLCLLLSACGGNSGGGGDNSGPIDPVVNAVAEGVWSGTDSSGHLFDMLLLENGDLYTLYGNANTIGFQAVGFIKGAYSISGNTLNAPRVTDFHYNDTEVTRTTVGLRATVIDGVSIKGTSTGAGTSTFSATPANATYASYDYNTPAALSDIAGAWIARLLDQTFASISITPEGVLAGSDLGCSFHGMVTPRPSGKNVFNVTYTYDASIATGCTAPGVTVTGIAISYVLPGVGGKRRLLAATTDTSTQLGYLFYGERN